MTFTALHRAVIVATRRSEKEAFDYLAVQGHSVEEKKIKVRITVEPVCYDSRNITDRMI